MIDLVGGQIQSIFATLVTALPHMKTGKIRGLAVTTKERAPMAPELPTISEAALPGFEANNWDGMLLPAGTPRADRRPSQSRYRARAEASRGA